MTRDRPKPELQYIVDSFRSSSAKHCPLYHFKIDISVKNIYKHLQEFERLMPPKMSSS